MINLLPIDEKKEIGKLYLIRFLTTCLFLFSVGILIFYILLIPSLSLTKTKENLIKEERKLLETSSEFVEFDALRETVSIVNSRIDIMNRDGDPLLHRDLITKLLLLKTPDITFQSIVYSKEGDSKQVELKGQARDRNALVRFIQIIENDPEVEVTSAPVSNFVTPNNLVYVLRLSLNSDK